MNVQSNSSSSNTLISSALDGLAWLLRPGARISSTEDRRRSQLLAGLILTSALVGALIIVIVLSLDSNDINDKGVQGGLVAIALGAVLYIANRLGYFQPAAIGYIAVISILFVAPPYLGKGADFLAFAIIPILVAGMLFSFRGSVIVAALLIAGIYVLNTLSANSVQQATPEILLQIATRREFWYFITLTSAIILVFIQHLASLESIRRTALEDTNRQLRDSEMLLEKRVEERTHDLNIAREQAEQANEVKSQFLASMSHELRTPLNAIINLSEFIKDGMLGPVNEEQKRSAGNVVESGQHLLALINDILDISKIEAGALQLFVEDNVDIDAELHNMERAAHSLLRERETEVAVKLELEAPIPTIRGDRLRLRQILYNLISNACKFTEHGSITIGASRHNGTLTVSVKDTGPGIQPQDMLTIFETFRQTEVGLRKGTGTGLGLPIARRLAEAHGGTLTVESVPGQGAKFIVSLPVKAEHLVPTVVNNSRG